MSIDQFAMVEELAHLVRDNIPCKHLVLAVEEALVNFLKDDFGEDGILELEPMNPYNRLLLHRLADIFGFAHESVGEGDERHLIFQRCPETSIPSILVSDILWQYNEQPVETTHQLLRRKDAPTVLVTNVPSYQHSFEEREAAYFAARERIFADDVERVNESVKQRPRHVPIVAQRMIAHALGQKMVPLTKIDDGKDGGGPEELDAQQTIEALSNSRLKTCQDTDFPPEPDLRSISDGAKSKRSPHLGGIVPHGLVEETLATRVSQNGSRKNDIDDDYLKKEQLGAAKRMFAQALGRHSAKHGLSSNCGDLRQSHTE